MYRTRSFADEIPARDPIEHWPLRAPSGQNSGKRAMRTADSAAPSAVFGRIRLAIRRQRPPAPHQKPLHGPVLAYRVPFGVERRRAATGVAESRPHVPQVVAGVERVVRMGVPQPVGAGPRQIRRCARVRGPQQGGGSVKMAL